MFHVKYNLFSLFHHTSNVAVQSIGKYRRKPPSSRRGKKDALTYARNEILAIGFGKRIMESE
jgi:hypothetical protein